MELFNTTTLEDTVKLHPKELNKHYISHIQKHLRTKYEGKCTKFGLILPNSIEMVSTLRNSVELHTFHGFVLFDVRFNATVCNPAENTVITARVINMNSFAILCFAGDVNEGGITNAVDVIVPRNISNIIDSSSHKSYSTNDVKIGDRVNVEIIGKKHQHGSKKIGVIGRLVDHLPKAPTASFVEEATKNKLTLDEEDEDDDVTVASNFGDDNISEDGSDQSLFEDGADGLNEDDDMDRDILKSDDASDIEDEV